jgi:hypothetical protein
VVSFTPRPLYPQRKSPWYPFDRRVGTELKSQVKRRLRFRRRQEDNIKMDIKGIRCESADWIQLVCRFEPGNEPTCSIKIGEFF